MKHIHYLAMLVLFSAMLMSCSSSRKNSPAVKNGGEAILTELSNKMGIAVPASANTALVQEILDWKGTPYKYGGSTKQGVDCSGLIGQVYQTVFMYQPPRTTADMQKMAKPVPANEMKEGDIVFFEISSSKPNHSGIYLWNGYFAHASTTKGVMVSSLSEAYWSKYFVGAGRFLQAKP